MVANKFLEEVEMTDHIRKECVLMCKYFHESVRMTSERYVICYLGSISLDRLDEIQLIWDFSKAFK